MAVKKSRAKVRNLRDEALEQMTCMSQEKDQLESMMGSLSDEIKMLKDVLIGITGGHMPSSFPSSDTIDLTGLKYFDLSK